MHSWLFFLGPALGFPFLILAVILPYGMSFKDIRRNTLWLLAVCVITFIGILLPIFFHPQCGVSNRCDLCAPAQGDVAYSEMEVARSTDRNRLSASGAADLSGDVRIARVHPCCTRFAWRYVVTTDMVHTGSTKIWPRPNCFSAGTLPRVPSRLLSGIHQIIESTKNGYTTRLILTIAKSSGHAIWGRRIRHSSGISETGVCGCLSPTKIQRDCCPTTSLKSRCTMLRSRNYAPFAGLAASQDEKPFA